MTWEYDLEFNHLAMVLQQYVCKDVLGKPFFASFYILAFNEEGCAFSSLCYFKRVQVLTVIL